MASEEELRRQSYERWLGEVKGIKTGTIHNQLGLNRNAEVAKEKAAYNEAWAKHHPVYVPPIPPIPELPRHPPLSDLYPAHPSPGQNQNFTTSESSYIPLWQIILGTLIILSGLVSFIDFVSKLTAEDWVLAGLYVVLITVVVSVIILLVKGIRRFFQSEPGKIVMRFINITSLGLAIFMLLKWALFD